MTEHSEWNCGAQPPMDVAQQEATSGDIPELRVAVMQVVGDAVIEKLTTAQVESIVRGRGVEVERTELLSVLKALRDKGAINGEKRDESKEKSPWDWWAR